MDNIDKSNTNINTTDNDQLNEHHLEIKEDSSEEVSHMETLSNKHPINKSEIEKVSSIQNDSYVFITNPELKEGINKYIVYSVYIRNNPFPLLRKYSDFIYLREKLTERFPGVFIPNIPEKQSDGNTDTYIIEMNIKLLNRFCEKLFSIVFISNSPEVQLFFSNIEDIVREIDRLPQLSFKDIIDRYKIAIPLRAGSHSFDSTKSKEQLKEHHSFISDLLHNIKNFKDYAKETKQKKSKEISNYICLLNVFQDYEKHALMEYTDNNEAQLVFSNQLNKELKGKYDTVISSLRNPYITLNEWLEEDECDLKGMIEVYDSIKHFESEYNRLNNRVIVIEDEIQKYNKGESKTSLASLLSFKTQGDIISERENEKEVNQIGMYYLDIIIAMVSEYSISNFDSFKQSKLNDYYKHLKQFNDIQLTNNKCIIDLWQSVQRDTNVKCKDG